MKTTNLRKKTVWLCTTAMFMALNVALSSFGVPVPGGHLYMNDIVICLASIILDPLAAFLVGGVGAFLGEVKLREAHIAAAADNARDIALCASRAEKAPCYLVGNRRYNRRGHHGGRLLSRQSVHIQHSRIRRHETSLSDTSGGCRRRRRYASLLGVRLV